MGKIKAKIVADSINPPKIDLTGKIFGKLTVIKYIGKSKWLCVCTCGNTTNTRTADLNNGNSKGCRQCINRITTPGIAGFNNLWSKYKTRATKLNREFLLTKEEFRILTSDNCHYCGNSPILYSTSTKSNVSKETFEHSKYLYNGIDRIDSSKGYTNDNCVTCCEMCNKAKRDVSYEDFIMYLKQISKYYANKD